MGTNVTNNNHSSDGTGLIVLGIVALSVVAAIFALIVATLWFIVMAVTGISTVVLCYKVYKLHVQKTIALAAISAGMIPPPFPMEQQQIPTVREFMLGRGSNG